MPCNMIAVFEVALTDAALARLLALQAALAWATVLATLKDEGVAVTRLGNYSLEAEEQTFQLSAGYLRVSGTQRLRSDLEGKLRRALAALGANLLVASIVTEASALGVIESVNNGAQTALITLEV